MVLMVSDSNNANGANRVNGLNGEMGRIGENFDASLMGRREDDFDSRSGSENFDASGDEADAGDDQQQNKRKKKFHRHIPQQIQDFFKECPHPDEKQRVDLSRKLGLDNKQVKFWFQNKRTQMKTQLERHENMLLREENEKLRAENSMLKEAPANPICNNCGGQGIPGEISMDDQRLRIENARLKEELARLSALTAFLGRPVSALIAMSMQNPNLGLEFGMRRNGIASPSNYNMQLPMGFFMGDGVMGSAPANYGMQPPMGMVGNDPQHERSMLIDLALAAMNELMKLCEPESPLWIKSPDTGKDVLNIEEYGRNGSPFNTPIPNGYITEATREIGLLYTDTDALVETFLDADRWSEMFPCMIAHAATLDVLSNGMGGTRNGAMQVMQAEVQLPSPFVPVRQYHFLRFCKQHAEGIWVVVDVSVDLGRNGPNDIPYMSCKKLPSGCILQDMDGMCKITWVDHSQYDESVVHQTYRTMVSSGLAFGAQRWVATLQRHCESLAILMAAAPSDDPTVISLSGKRSMSKLASGKRSMTDYFWSGVSPSSACKWEIIPINNMGSIDMRIMSRKIPDASGENLSIVLSAATSVWMPLSRKRVFDFLRDARLRGEWDLLSSGGTMQEMVHIATGGLGNSVSIISTDNAANGNEGLYLQDSWTDSSGSMVVYSPINMQSLSLVMSGRDASFVALLPSGFSILPDGYSSNNNIIGTSSDRSSSSGNDNDNGGCLLTIGLQMLLNNHPSSKLTDESVDTVNNHLATTIQKVKDALGVA
ncbi:homeobox-leucine zipper protein ANTHOCYANINLESS [Trifolium repens]|nr:homeobox-leucine zipper protein ANTHOCYANINLESS [Trifolium repens]